MAFCKPGQQLQKVQRQRRQSPAELHSRGIRLQVSADMQVNRVGDSGRPFKQHEMVHESQAGLSS